MKTKNLFLTALCALSLGLLFTACKDDDGGQSGPTSIALNRAVILNEGSYGYNNSNLISFDWSKKDGQITDCIYTEQNGKQLGDTGNDIITFNNRMAVAVNGSNYLTMLDSEGKELSRISFADGVDGHQVQVRNVIEKDGYLYVSTYGGLLLKVRVNADKLELAADYVNIGTNLEWLCELNGKIYVVVAGPYPNNDHRIAIVPVNNFNTEAVTYADVMYNPDQMIVAGGRLYVQGYGNYDYPFGEYDPATGTYTQKGNATAWGAYKKTLYLANSVTMDWVHYTTTLSAYNTATGENNTEFFKDVPEDLEEAFVYNISVNPYNGDIYVCTSDYVTDGQIYIFSADGNYTGVEFLSGGLNPNKIVFLKVIANV